MSRPLVMICFVPRESPTVSYENFRQQCSLEIVFTVTWTVVRVIGGPSKQGHRTDTNSKNSPDLLLGCKFLVVSQICPCNIVISLSPQYRGTNRILLTLVLTARTGRLLVYDTRDVTVWNRAQRHEAELPVLDGPGCRLRVQPVRNVRRCVPRWTSGTVLRLYLDWNYSCLQMHCLNASPLDWDYSCFACTVWSSCVSVDWNYSCHTCSLYCLSLDWNYSFYTCAVHDFISIATQGLLISCKVHWVAVNF